MPQTFYPAEGEAHSECSTWNNSESSRSGRLSQVDQVRGEMFHVEHLFFVLEFALDQGCEPLKILSESREVFHCELVSREGLPAS